MELQSFSCHKITDKKRMSFSKKEYSWFKYGSKTVARQFGYELANSFLKSKLFIDIVLGHREKKIVVASSPYEFIPTATFAMKDYFIQMFNEKLVELDMQPVEEVKIHRKCSYVTDYGSMSEEERKSRITGDGFHIDKEFVKDKLVIFLDDIKITGAHESRIKTLITDYSLECEYMFMYFAESLLSDPQVEDFLNLYSIDSLIDINTIIRNQEFMFNTRVTKFILKAPTDEFLNFISYQSDSFKENLFRNAIGNSYHLSELFSQNILILKQTIKQK